MRAFNDAQRQFIIDNAPYMTDRQIAVSLSFVFSGMFTERQVQKERLQQGKVKMRGGTTRGARPMDEEE